jgi:hypothetical protein
MDLATLDFTPEKLLLAITRATHARYRYMALANARGERYDVPVEHQLMNHINLLVTVARSAEISSDQTDAAIVEGVRQAHAEAQVS